MSSGDFKLAVVPKHLLPLKVSWKRDLSKALGEKKNEIKVLVEDQAVRGVDIGLFLFVPVCFFCLFCWGRIGRERERRFVFVFCL